MPAGSRVLEPRSFVAIKPLPFAAAAQGLKVRARSLAVYIPSEPSREHIFRDNYRRRQRQLNQQGYRSLSWQPYQPIGHPLQLAPRKLVLHSLGQLHQAVIDEATAASEDRPDEAKDSRSPNVPKENKVPAANRINLKYKDKDLKTISKDLSHTRQLVNTAKQGHGFFKRLQREEQEKKLHN